MKILLLIPLWKRPEVVRLFIWRMEAVLPDYAEIMPMFILSPEDPCLNILEKFTSEYTCMYYPNEYLGDKMNAGMLYATRYEWDYLMNIGSDNIYTPLLWEMYRDYFESQEKYFGINDCYVYDLQNDRAFYLKSYIDETALGGIGAGRIIHRSLLEADPCIYRPKTCQGMDGFSAMTLYRRGYQMKIIDTDDRAVMLDIKTNTNVNHALMVWPQRTRDVSVKWIREEFGLVDSQILDDGTFDLLSFDGFHSQVVKLSQTIKQRDAFNAVNLKYEMTFGEGRYKNLESYQVQVSKKFKR